MAAKTGVISEFFDLDKFEKEKKQILDGMAEVAAAVAQGGNKVKGAGTIGEQKKAQEELNKVNDEAARLTKKLTDLDTQQAREVAELKEKIKQKNKEINDEITSNKNLVGAYRALEAEARKATKAAKDLAAQYGANSVQAKTATTAAKQLNDKLKEIDATMGLHQRNVGNYTSAFGKLGDKLSEMPGPINKIGGAMQNLSRMMAVNPVFLAITAVTAAIGGLVASLKNTDEAADEVNAKMAGMKAAFEVVTDRAANFAIGLGKFITGEYREGIRQVADAFKGLGDNIRSAALAADAYTRAMDRIEEANTQFISDEAQLRNEAAKQIEIYQDQTRSYDERRIALQRAMDAERQIYDFKKVQAKSTYDAELKYAAGMVGISEKVIRFVIEGERSKVEAVRDGREGTEREQEAVRKVYNKLYGKNGELAKRVEEAYAAVLNTDSELNESRKRSVSKLSGFIDQINKESEALRDNADARAEVIASVIAEQRARLSGQLVGPGVVNPEGSAAISKIRSIGIMGSKTPSPEIAKVGQTPLGGEGGDEMSAEAAMWQQRIQMVQSAVSQIDAIVNASYQNRLAMIDSEASADEQARERELKMAEGNTAQIMAINARYDAKEKEREKEKRRVQKEQAKYQKTSSLISAIINTAVGVTGMLANPGGTLGIVLAALALATGLAEVAVISSQPIPSYAKGRKGGKAEIANVGEKGTEAIVTKDGQVSLTPSTTTTTFLPEGASVIPHHELVDMAGGASLRMPNYTTTRTDRLEQEIRGLHMGFRMLKHTIENKRENYINITERGMQRMAKEGNTWTEWINDRVM